MPKTVLKMSFDLFGHTAYPLPQIELVGALIEQDAAALARPCCTPVARIIICLRTVPVGYYPVGTAYIAVLTALYKLTHFAINAVCTLIEHHTEHYIRMLF